MSTVDQITWGVVFVALGCGSTDCQTRVLIKMPQQGHLRRFVQDPSADTVRGK